MNEVSELKQNMSTVFINKKLPRSTHFGVKSFYDNGKVGKRTPSSLLFSAPSFESYSIYTDFSQLKRHIRMSNDGHTLKTLEKGTLYGCGGAHFPVALKWKAALKQSGSRYLVVNGQEGEIDTFKDYYLMLNYPQILVEGAALAAMALDAKRIFIVINSSYDDCISAVTMAVEQLKAELPSFKTEITVTTGPKPDLYVCGEETALIEYMNGNRAEPQIRPPFPFQRGYKGQPTVVQNVETVSWIPLLLDDPNVYDDNGELKLVTIWGDVEKPGIYEIPMGVSLNQLLIKAGGLTKGSTLNAIEIGGLAGGILPASYINLTYEHSAIKEAGGMIGTGSVRFLNKEKNLFEEVKKSTVFFRDESCGRCSPCRVGTQLLVQLIKVIESGQASDEVGEQMADVIEVMTNASLCALGKGAPSYLLSYLRYWGERELGLSLSTLSA